MATDRHQAPSYPLRMPDELKARVQAAAVASGRSLHAELIHRIQQSFEVSEGSAQPDLVLEMRRTQLHLELNSSKQELVQLYAEGKDLQRRLEEAQDVNTILELEKTMDAIHARKMQIDRHTSEVRSRLAELDALSQADRIQRHHL